MKNKLATHMLDVEFAQLVWYDAHPLISGATRIFLGSLYTCERSHGMSQRLWFKRRKGV